MNSSIFCSKVVKTRLFPLRAVIQNIVLRPVHIEQKRTRKRKRSKNNRKRSKKKIQTLKKFFTYAFTFARCEQTLRRPTLRMMLTSNEQCYQIRSLRKRFDGPNTNKSETNKHQFWEFIWPVIIRLPECEYVMKDLIHGRGVGSCILIHRAKR